MALSESFVIYKNDAGTWLPLATGLLPDRKLIEQELGCLLQADPPQASPFQAAMQYAVLGPGQRLRPMLALRIARVLSDESHLVLRAAAAVEILHCASLVVDDLPCMDNESERRGRPTTHIVYGHCTALLASFGLVALAARSVVEVPCTPAQMSFLIRFQIELLKVLDASGLCEGQDMDLRLQGQDRECQRSRINELKTVPLFDLAAQAGLLLCDPMLPEARQLRRFAQEFGRCYQVADDYLDGEISDFSLVEGRLERARACLAPFAPAAGELHAMLDYLHERCLSFSPPQNLRHR